MAIGPIIIDTNSYSSFKRGETEAVEIIRHVPAIIINPIILGELLGGFELGIKHEENKKELELFLQSQRVKFVSIDRKTSEYYSIIYKELRKKGKPIPTNDIWIAATAMQHGLSVYSYDEHFNHIPNLYFVICNLILNI